MAIDGLLLLSASSLARLAPTGMGPTAPLQRALRSGPARSSPERTSTTPGTVRARPTTSSPAELAGPGDADDAVGDLDPQPLQELELGGEAAWRSVRMSSSSRATRRSRSRRATMPTTRSPATAGTDLRWWRSIIRAAAVASVS